MDLVTWEVPQSICDAEEEEGCHACSEKLSLFLLIAYKTAIGFVQQYDNSLGSALLFDNRAGALRTLMRQKRVNNSLEKVLCHLCAHEVERVNHVVLQCDRLGPNS